MMSEECACTRKQIGIAASIILIVSGLIAWSLISLYSTTPALEETVAEEELEEELPEEEVTPPQATKEEKVKPAPAPAKPKAESKEETKEE
ncbi:MAG: hypothetical protein HYT97_05975 [Elusimicrobia bacterium]|nr:hypothetical protein [Elusimicrobiota bacterium]